MNYKKIIIHILGILFISLMFISYSKAQTKVYVGYTNIRADDITFQGFPIPIREAHSITGSIQSTIYKHQKFSFQGVGEFSTNVNRSLFHQYLGGSQVTYSPTEKFDIYGRALFGVHRANAVNYFSKKLAVGVDVNLFSHFFVRPLEVGRLVNDNFLKKNITISSGIGLRF